MVYTSAEYALALRTTSPENGGNDSVQAGVIRMSRSCELLRRNVKRFRGGLIFKAHKLLYRSAIGLIVKKKKKKARVRRH